MLFEKMNKIDKPWVRVINKKLEECTNINIGSKEGGTQAEVERARVRWEVTKEKGRPGQPGRPAPRRRARGPAAHCQGQAEYKAAVGNGRARGRPGGGSRLGRVS